MSLNSPALSDLPDASVSPAVPRWQAIAAALRQDIAAGVLPPGERLPNETLLALRFGVHRHTVRQALQALAREGFVQVRQGSGTYVRALVLDYALQRRTRLTQNVAESGEQARRECLAQQRAAAGAWAQALQVPPRSRVQVLYTRALVRGRPIGLGTSVFPLPRFEGIAEAFHRHGGISAALADRGVADYTRARSTIRTRMPTESEADALARPPTQPVLVVDYVNVDLQGRPVEAGSTLFAADAVQLTVDAAEVLDARPRRVRAA